MRSPFISCVGALLLSCSIGAFAQLLPPRGGPLPPVTATAPQDPHELLTFFQGNWEIAGMPAGRSFFESCDWMSQARRHLVCRARTETGNTVEESLSVMSYRTTDGVYLYHAFEPDGSVFTMEGRRQANGNWSFVGERGTGANRQRTRMTVLPGGERSFVLQQEVAVGNQPWQRQGEVRYVPALRR